MSSNYCENICAKEYDPVKYAPTGGGRLKPGTMVVGVDLSAFVQKIHEHAGDYIADARFNIGVLEARQSSGYLMMILTF